MTNKEIRNQLQLVSMLMELHDENPFKAKSYASAAQIIDNVIDYPLEGLAADQLETIEGIGKKVAACVVAMNETGSFEELETLLSSTPKGVVDMLGIKGLGAKKIRTLWKDLGIEDLITLKSACEEDRVSKLKGFGAKTQEKALAVVEFTLANAGKKLYAEVEELSIDIEKQLAALFPQHRVSISGMMRRKCQLVNKLEFLVEGEPKHDAVNKITPLKENKLSSPFCWRGTAANQIDVEVKFVPSEKFISTLLVDSSSEEHLAYHSNEQTLLQLAHQKTFDSEKAIYDEAGLPLIQPVYREGLWELEAKDFSNIIRFEDLKGCLHNHSVYSDGKNTIKEMAEQCRKMGYEYFGISDHSKTAFYANGLYEDRVAKQHKEIDALNAQMNDFKIFKSIESDILNEGELDYANDVLASFDFIVASVHANLGMDIQKATQRLITAIENPYTTMLGHATGRLLLRREGYPIHHKKIIDACAENKVIIEINANPWRLDIDWTWIQYCMEKGVMLSINPDAHALDGIYDMYYGTLVAQKGGLTKDMCFNAKSTKEVEAYFVNIKKEKGI